MITINEPNAVTILLADVQAGSIVVVTEGDHKGDVLVINSERNPISITEPTRYFGVWDTRVRVLPRGTSITFSVGNELTADDETKVRQLMSAGRKIDAIKHVRTVTSLDLKAAKELAEKIGY